MGRALTVTRMDHTAAELRAAASKSGNAAQVRRLLAIALVLDGDARMEAAEQWTGSQCGWTQIVTTSRSRAIGRAACKANTR